MSSGKYIMDKEKKIKVLIKKENEELGKESPMVDKVNSVWQGNGRIR